MSRRQYEAWLTGVAWDRACEILVTVRYSEGLCCLVGHLGI